MSFPPKLIFFTMAKTIFNFQSSRARTIWLSCLASAFRTALACIIVGCITLYGPATIKHYVAFPAFSYVTVILILTDDATLGDTIRGCWLALYATVQSVGPAILSLWLIEPANLTSYTTALAVAGAAFVVVSFESTHLVAKRIALGQIVIIYVIGFINGGKTQAVMHPVHVAASTAAGVLACVLALLLPYPRLACFKVKENSKLYGENTSKRLKLFVKAFSAEDKTSASASLSQARSMTSTASKLLQNLKSMQESMQWEKLPFRCVKNYYTTPLQDLEGPLRGMEMALTSCSTPLFPIITAQNSELKDGVEKHLSLTLKQVERSWFSTCDTTQTERESPELNAENAMKSLKTFETIIPPTRANLPSLFFIFCMNLLRRRDESATNKNNKPSVLQKDDGKAGGLLFFFTKQMMNVNSKKRVMAAFKCSISLGLAVLLGLLYSKENGFWSGLPVAISFASAREATFKVANLKAQGTVFGTVYGVIGCFLFQKFLAIRFMSLLPWFIFTTFLRRSRMYAQAGGISAVIGAVLILGRTNYGPPSEFAIARIMETFIGLSCSIMVDIIMQPTRASTLAKMQLSKCLGTMHDCIIGLEENQNKKLKIDVNELNKFIGEAEVEPNFWFLPFHSGCYSKLSSSLSKMVDLLLFVAHAMEQEALNNLDTSWKEKLESDLKFFKEILSCSIKCFQRVTLNKSLNVLEKELEKKNTIFPDLELGNSAPKSKRLFLVSAEPQEDDEMEKIVNSYLQHLKEVVDGFHVEDEEANTIKKSQMVLNLSALGFCMNGLVQETRLIRKAIEELLQSENPSSHINLYDISCKLHALYN